MKRIHYGSLTIDVSNQIADLVGTLSAEAASSLHQRSVRFGNGFGFQPYASGRVEHVRLNGYVNGASDASEVEFLVGAGIPLLIQSIVSSLADPENAEAMGKLTAQVGEYVGDDGLNA